MYHVIPTKMICSKCKSEKIVAPCNEPKVDFRYLNCGHEKEHRVKTDMAATECYIDTSVVHTIEI